MSLYEQVINKLANEGWIIKMNSENIIPIPEIYSGNTFGFEEIAKNISLFQIRITLLGSLQVNT